MEAKQVSNIGFLQMPDENIIQALFNLEENKDFKVILNWILSSSGDVDAILRNADSEKMWLRAQGASRVLLALTSHASNPGEVLAKLKRQKAGIVFEGESLVASPPISV